MERGKKIQKEEPTIVKKQGIKKQFKKKAHYTTFKRAKGKDARDDIQKLDANKERAKEILRRFKYY